MDLQFTGEIWFWRGPAPHHFVTVPEEESAALESVSRAVSYGWGMIPVAGQIGRTPFTTALWPKDGGYIVPVKKAVQLAEDLSLGDVVTIRLAVEIDL